MGLEIGAIERSRRVDSQAWCIFFSQLKKIMTQELLEVRSCHRNPEYSKLGTSKERLSLSILFIKARDRMCTLCALNIRDRKLL